MDERQVSNQSLGRSRRGGPTDEAKMSSSAESFPAAWARRKLESAGAAASEALVDFLLFPIASGIVPKS